LREEITNYLYIGTVPTERKTFEYYWSHFDFFNLP
jgi:hypothetical protein